jgi:hypothetical protein
MVSRLEYLGLDLPDSVGEIIVCAILVLQGQHVLKVTGRFLQTWKQRGTILFTSHFFLYRTLY